MIQVFGFSAILTGLSQERIHFFLRAKHPRFLRLLTLKIEVTSPCETSATIYQSIRRNILQDQFSKIPLSASLISQPHKKFGIKVSIKL